MKHPRMVELALKDKCPVCHSRPDEWCKTYGGKGGKSQVLHSQRTWPYRDFGKGEKR